MSHRLGIATLIVALAMCFAASAAFADYTDETWFIGIQGGYAYVPAIGAFYDQYESVTAGVAGIQAGYSWKTIEAVGFLDHYSINIPEGDWLVKGDEEKEKTYMRYDLGMVALEGMARFKIPVNDVVVPILGVGLGLGFTYGKSEGLDYIATNPGGKEVLTRETEWEDEGKPSVLPVLDLMAGCRFVVHPNLTIDVNAGFKEGLYAGAGLIYFY